MTIYERIEVEMDRRGMFRAELARRSNIPDSTLRGWQRGSVPSAEALLSVSKALGVSLEYLVSGEKPVLKGLVIPDQEESNLIKLYRSLLEEDKKSLLVLADVLHKHSVDNNVTNNVTKT